MYTPPNTQCLAKCGLSKCDHAYGPPAPIEYTHSAHTARATVGTLRDTRNVLPHDVPCTCPRMRHVPTNITCPHYTASTANQGMQQRAARAVPHVAPQFAYTYFYSARKGY